MFQAKDLTDEQVTKLREWAAEGDQLNDLQRKLKDEYDLKVTYMDMRFAALDLNLEIQSEEVDEEEDSDSTGEPEIIGEGAAAAGGDGTVSVTVDQVTRPGAMVSGRVTFSDGEGGMWMIDSQGRPSLDPDTAGYRPSEPDIMAFQDELRKSLEGEGGGMGL
jgi:hypothetical protein